MVPLVLGLLLLSSCAKVSYVWDQGIGQMRLFVDGRKNESVLKDPKVSKEDKQKIRDIQVYKKFFYDFWKKKENSIYSETTFLKQEAVTYLVISSAFNEIKAEKECFPIAGCFPYLGFFSKEKAQKYASKKEKKEKFTYIRPVYAYSTLGIFEDNILSSFFYYNKYELAELIFHELFHTIFFIKGEVELNENLANYFAEEMGLLYFRIDEQKRELRKKKKERSRLLSKKLVELTKKLNQTYMRRSPKNKAEAKKLLESFLNDDFRPELKQLCHEIKDAHCYPLKRDWNNASLAAFLTYENKGDQISELHKKWDVGLKEFFKKIEIKYKTYKDKSIKGSFSSYLFSEL